MAAVRQRTTTLQEQTLAFASLLRGPPSPEGWEHQRVPRLLTHFHQSQEPARTPGV